MPDLVQALKEATAVWEHNRKMYPGWLVLPGANRPAVSANTNAWEKTTLQSLDHLNAVERLHIIRELLWRKKILLEPLTQELLTATENTLAMFNCQNQTVDQKKDDNADWNSIRENWRNSAIELLVEYRWNHDQEAFGKLIEDLRKFSDEDAEIQQVIYQERCLWALYELDFAELSHLLTEWETENFDPVWAMRKSAILSEMGRDDEAEQLRRQAIEIIRAMPREEQSVAGPSREGWAILPTSTWHSIQTIGNRMDELATLKCDAAQERDAIAKRIEGSRPRGQQGDPPSFDVGTRTVRHRFYSNYDQLVAAYQAVRLAEVAGLPPCATVLHEHFGDLPPFRFPQDVVGSVLKQAADKLTGSNLELAIRLLLRTCSSDTDEILERVMSRASIATLETQQAENLAQSCRKATDNAISNLEHQLSEWRLDVAIEALSRLVVRVPPDQAENILDLALELCRNEQLARGTGWTPIRHLLLRSWNSLPSEVRSRRAIGLLEAPLSGLDGLSPLAEYNWPDPAEALQSTRDALWRRPDNEQQWQAAVDATARGLVSNTVSRYRASMRMSHLVESGQLTVAETSKLAQALWDDRYTAPNELPTGAAAYDWGFLVLPEPSPGTAQERFRNRWLSGGLELNDYRSIQIGQDPGAGLNRNPLDVASQLWQTGHSIRSLHEKGQQLELSQTERQHLTELVETWATAPGLDRFLSEAPTFRNYYGNEANAVANVLPAVILEIGPPDAELGEKLFEKMRHLNDLQTPVFELASTVVQFTPARLEDTAAMLRVGISSNINEVAMNAASGILRWLSESSDPGAGVPLPPDDLVREIGIAIAYRRGRTLVPALQAARWVFENGTQANKDDISQLEPLTKWLADPKSGG